MLRLRINDNFYPLQVGRVDYMHGSEWTHTQCVQISDDVSELIDRNHSQDWPGFLRETIHFALIDGWVTEGTFREDDPDYEPIYWCIEDENGLIGRDALEDRLNQEVIVNLRVGTNRHGDPVDVVVEHRRIAGAEDWVQAYAQQHHLDLTFMERYGPLLVAVVE